MNEELMIQSELTEEESHELSLLLQRCGQGLHLRRPGRCGQIGVLMILGKWEIANGIGSGMTQQMLQERMRVQSGSISEIIGKLESRGYVRKARQPEDRRRINIYLTEEGRQRFYEKREAGRQQEHRLFSYMSAEEAREFKRMLERVMLELEAIKC